MISPLADEMAYVEKVLLIFQLPPSPRYHARSFMTGGIELFCPGK
jgi:hypothetical protein